MRMTTSAALLATASCLALAAALAPNAASAGTYTGVSNASELAAAIAAANADPDTSATIVLDASFTASGVALPAASKQIFLNTAGFTLTADEDLTGSSGLRLTGGGTFVVRSDAAFAGIIDSTATNWRVENGGHLTGSAFQPGGNGAWSVTVTGPGSELATNGAVLGGVGTTGTLLVEDGGVFRTGGGNLSAAGSVGTVSVGITVTGQDSILETRVFSLGLNGAAAGSLTVSDGGRMTDTQAILGLAIGVHTGAPPSMVVTDPGSEWATSGSMNIYAGSLSVLNGGAVSVGGLAELGSVNRADLLISGPGSSFTASTNMTLGGSIGSFVTLANAGVLNVGGVLTTAAGSAPRVLNIGGAEAQAAAAPGVLNAPTVAFGGASGRLNFNHTATNYDFGVAMSGSGSINQVAGVTRLTGDNSGFTGTTTISGGTLSVGNGGATGSIAGNIVNNSTLTFDRTGSLTYGGAISGTGGVNIRGGGMLTLTGNSAVTGNASLAGSGLRLENGGKFSAGAFFGSAGSTITVTGAGSELASSSSLNLSSTPGSLTLLVEDGGLVRSTGTFGAGTGAGAVQADVTVTGPTARIDSGLLTLGTNNASIAVLTLTAGGRINSAGATVGHFSLAHTATPPSATISGPNSQWAITGPMNQHAGSVSVLNGGAVSVTTTGLIGGGPTRADLLVSGAGATYTVTGNLNVGTGVNVSAAGFVTLANAGLLDVDGLLTLTNGATKTGVLNIGGAEGQAATGAGTLDTSTLALGPGNARLNFNHTSTNYDFDTAVTGAGAINQVAGVTHLTGASTGYTGLTTISGGELRVDGTLGGAASTVAVNAGGLLGGDGTIGGDVIVANGGVLAPGNSPGTLTIAGDLVLNGGSVLNMEFGAADDPGNALNDLIVVGGDLTLDGTINVTETAGGVFGDGVYRIIDYTGLLTDNGLDVGVLPAGSATVQTSFANQVNLIVSGISGGGGGGGGGGPPRRRSASGMATAGPRRMARSPAGRGPGAARARPGPTLRRPPTAATASRPSPSSQARAERSPWTPAGDRSRRPACSSPLTATA